MNNKLKKLNWKNRAVLVAFSLLYSALIGACFYVAEMVYKILKLIWQI